jgi:uncharacterized protein YbjT (DUF2867 family)
MKTALVFGATGLVGGYLVDKLLSNPEYSSIKIFSRRPLNTVDKKIKEHIIDLNTIENSVDQLVGDDVFICLGTTLKKAGSVAEVEKIDWHLPVKIATIAKNNGIENLAIVSSIGANYKSGNYYLRTKGAMEKELSELGIKNLKILRPSLLLGERSESRFAEGASKFFMKGFGILLLGKLKKYRAIHGRTVAKAMIKILAEKGNQVIYESDSIQAMGSAT